MLRIVIPLVSKVLIDEFTLAKAFNDASKQGLSTEGMIAPKSLGYSIGIAFALFAMLSVSSFFFAHAHQRWGQIGLATRGAVSGDQTLIEPS
jgi:ATP-binding cassette subfamily C (CFTR/MRP) protein 1